MTEEDRAKPPLIENWSADRSQVRYIEVPSFDELLRDRIEGLKPDARAFLKLQMLMRDQDVIGRIFRPSAIVEMLEDLSAEGTITTDHAVDLFNAAHETHDAFLKETLREARELGIARPDPSKPERIQ